MDSPPTADESWEPPRPLTDAPAAVGEVLEGRWAVSEIRRGGQAWVVVADDIERGVRRAIKTPLSGTLAGDAELAMLLGLEPHPHTVTTLDVIELGGRTGIVFEYAPSTLADLIGREPGVALAVTLQQVCAGMAHLSKVTEVAHLDLKPSNVLVDDNGHAKVADFGLAQHVRIQDGRFPTARGGTWAYAAPEVLRQEPCDTRADIFSFGVLLYEACTGKLPYPFPLAPNLAAQRAQLLDYYASERPRRRAEQLYWWGQSTTTEVPVTPPSEGIGILLSACLDELMEARPETFRIVTIMLAQAFQKPPVETEAIALPEVDKQLRELALGQVLMRLGRFDEAVNRLNRLLATPMSIGRSTTVLDAMQQALTGAGRHAEAAELRNWR